MRPTDTDVRLTLVALRRGERNVAALPLAPVVADDGSADGVAAERLRLLLARLAWDSLCRARGAADAAEPATAGAADAAIAADFQSGVAEREAWSALYHRYFGPRIGVGHIAAAAGVDRRTMQRRFELGYRRLAERIASVAAVEGTRRATREADDTAVAGGGVPPLHRLGLAGSLKPFVGRADALQALAELTARERLVTVTGPGGVGKSRLALEVALRAQRVGDRGSGGSGSSAGGSDRAGSIVWVALDDVEDGERVAAAMQRAFEPIAGPASATPAAIGAAIGPRPLLVVADRAEQVLGSVAQWVEALLRQCPALQWIVTSRSPLRVAGEQLYPLEPLGVPPPGADTPSAVRASEAGALFEARARAVRPSWRLDDGTAPAVATICRRLDGLPLAIELAAAQTRRTSAADIARQLDARFELLVDGERSAPERHRTLRDALAWSVQHLEPGHQTVLARLTVFRGAFDTDDAVAACADGTGAADGRDAAAVRQAIHALVDRSLLHVVESPDGHYRYRLLETVRDLVCALLPDDDRHRRLERMTDDLRAAARSAAAALDGPDGPRAASRLRAREGDVVAAVERLADSGRAEEAVAMAADLGEFWLRSGLLATGRRCLELALAHAAPALEPPLAARAHEALGAIARKQGDYALARRHLEAALAARSALADRPGMASTLRQLGTVADEEADYARAEACYREALAIYEALGDDWGVAAARNNLGVVATNVGRTDEAERLLGASLAGFAAQDATWAVGVVHFNLGNAAFDRAAYAKADAHYRASLAIAIDGDDDPGIVAGEIALGNVAERRGDWDAARRHYASAWQRLAPIGDLQEVAEWLEAVAHLARGAGDMAQAARAYAAAAELRRRIGAPVVPKDMAEIEADVAGLEAALGPDAFGAAWVEGTIAGWRAVATDWAAGILSHTGDGPKHDELQTSRPR